MGIKKGIIKYGIPAALMVITTLTSGCASYDYDLEPNPAKTEFVSEAVAGETLEEKLEDLVEYGDYTIKEVHDFNLQYLLSYDAADASVGYGLSRPIKIVIARPAEISAESKRVFDTFIYLGNRPLEAGSHVTIYYRPVIDGKEITNNDLVAKIISPDCTLPHDLDFVIEGYYGPKSIIGITGSELQEGGIVIKGL